MCEGEEGRALGDLPTANSCLLQGDASLLMATSGRRPVRNAELTAARTGAEPEEPALVRCSSCLGLRTVAHRNRGSVARCPDCRRGEVVSRGAFRAWWLERFSAEECAELARAILG